MKAAFLFALALPSPLQAAEEHAAANPIRKVVNMLQMMQKKVEAEGEKEQELFDKFMCYCKNSGGDLRRALQMPRPRFPSSHRLSRKPKASLANSRRT